jgi:hexosaminidase
VKIVPEFDAPAHVGNGWQFAEQKHPEWGRLAVCNNQEEWQDYAVEPPAGQVHFCIVLLFKQLFDGILIIVVLDKADISIFKKGFKF